MQGMFSAIPEWLQLSRREWLLVGAGAGGLLVVELFFWVLALLFRR
jgi:hypothetical protein